jgi:hypothetical protein
VVEWAKVHLFPPEMWLFEFSTNYCPNNKLMIKANYLFEVDLEVAQDLERRWLNLRQR